MPYLQHRRIEPRAAQPVFPPQEPILDDASQLRAKPGAVVKGAKPKESSSKRRGYYANALRRQEVVFGPEVRSARLAP